MTNQYDPKNSEPQWQKFWEDNNINKFDRESWETIYSIDTPPPTISWKIHIGHIFSYTQAEVIGRFQRMFGKNLFYPFWFDDNWLPTERLVEKEIWKKAVDMDRFEFVEECNRVTAGYREKFQNLWKSIGLSVDWTLQYSTVSKDTQRLSQQNFLNLLKKDVIYKKNSPALWCIECQTSVAQAEVEDKELDWIFYDLRFKLEDWTDIVVATTRPELLPACVAVFVNPEDSRYQSIIWKKIITPLGSKVEIMSDDKVSQEKWTWVVMCCTYWDETDMYWVKKYNLPEKIIIDKKWHIQNTWIQEIDGFFIKKAKNLIVEKLKNQWDVLWEKQIKHSVWTHERCGTPIEIITTSQWFVKILDKKEELLKLGDQINWYPDFMKKRYVDRVENLKWDWCISRQRYFGIPVPVWYSKKTGEQILPELSQLPIDPLKDKPINLPENHTYEDIYPDYDVLDTWATSSITPMINSDWKKSGILNNNLLPMDLRPQAHDIIRTWAFYTIVMSMYNWNTVPFKNVMISGHVLAWKGEKISKSKDNAGTTPEQLIENYWADPVRYWTCWGSLWKNVVFDEGEIKNGRKLVTKLWNATNFAILNLWDFDPTQAFDESNLQPVDKWILIKIREVAKNIKNFIENFEFWLARIEYEKFFWTIFTDNYLELIKDKIYNPWKYQDWNMKKLSAQYALYHGLLNVVKLISPILPHVTEELYQNYFRKFEWTISIHKTKYPEIDFDSTSFAVMENEMTVVLDLIDKIRKWKVENWIKLWEEFSKLIVIVKENNLSKYVDDLKSISKAKEVEIKMWEEVKCEIIR